MNKYIENKNFIESFCSEIIEQLEKVCYKYIPNKKKEINATKNLAHVKKKGIFHITKYPEALQNGITKEILFLENIVRDLRNCRIINKKPLLNGYNLTKLSYGNDLRIHQLRYSFNNIEWATLSKPIRENNLTIWSPNAQSIMFSIGSRQNKELCNMALLSEGFKQIAKRYTFLDTLKIIGLLRKKKVNVEIGIDVLSSEKEIRELGYEFLPKTYELYGVKFWFDKSRDNGIELDYSFNCGLNDIVTAFKFIESLPYLIRIAKEIEVRKKLLESYNKLKLEQKNSRIKLDITRLRNGFTNIRKGIYEIKDLCNFIYRNECITYNES